MFGKHSMDLSATASLASTLMPMCLLVSTPRTLFYEAGQRAA